MGYETTLLIGKSGHTSDEVERGVQVYEDNELYKPYLKNDNGDYIQTGRKETYFFVYATIDLCKCAYSGEIHKLDTKNTDKNHYWMWYEGNEEKTEDAYGEKPKPVKIKDVITAIEKDSTEEDNYRRFDWALGMLRAMENDPEEITVLLIGH